LKVRSESDGGAAQVELAPVAGPLDGNGDPPTVLEEGRPPPPPRVDGGALPTALEAGGEIDSPMHPFEGFDGSSFPPVFYRLRTRGKPQWGLSVRIMGRLRSAGVDVLDFRSRMMAGTTMSELHLEDSKLTAPPSLELPRSVEKLLRSRQAALVALVSPLLGSEAQCAIERWVPQLDAFENAVPVGEASSDTASPSVATPPSQGSNWSVCSPAGRSPATAPCTGSDAALPPSVGRTRSLPPRPSSVPPMIGDYDGELGENLNQPPSDAHQRHFKPQPLTGSSLDGFVTGAGAAGDALE